MPEKPLVQKLAEVMALVKHVPKRGRNEFHRYDYATEADITDAVRSALAERGIMIIPSVANISWRQVQTKNGPQDVCTLLVQFTIADGHQQIQFTAVGEGQDGGDKNTYKAMTGALKYALLKLFLIPTGDDPEEEEQKPARRASAATPPAPAPASGGLDETQSARLKAAAERAGKGPEDIKAVIKALFAAASSKRLVWSEEMVRKVEKELQGPPARPAEVA